MEITKDALLLLGFKELEYLENVFEYELENDRFTLNVAIEKPEVWIDCEDEEERNSTSLRVPNIKTIEDVTTFIKFFEIKKIDLCQNRILTQTKLPG